MRCFGAVARALARRYEWEKDGFGDLLMMALPHHVDTMVGASGQDAAFVMNDSYQCIKVREGRARLEEPLHDIQKSMREYQSVYCFETLSHNTVLPIGFTSKSVGAVLKGLS